jgi:RHS repeat-associated protein
VSADGGNVVLDFVDPDGSGAQPMALSKRYLYGEAVDQLFAQEDLSKTLGDAARNLRPLVDHLGTVRDLARQDGTIAVHYKYDSFGRVTSGDTSKTRYLFTSRELDPATGLQYNRARWYDGRVGRWISEDPLGFVAGDGNLGRFVRNQVFDARDPSGLQQPPYIPPDGSVIHCVPRYRNGRIVGGIGGDVGRYPSPGGEPKLGYWGNAVMLVFVGDYGEAEPNAAGVIGSIGFGVIGGDVYKDVADIVYGVHHWEGSWGDVGNMIINGIGILPVVGAIKNVKHAKGIKHVDEAVDVPINALQPAIERGMRIIRGPSAPDQMVEVLEKVGKPMTRKQIGEIIHKAKNKMMLGPTDDLIFDRSGGMWDPRTGEYIGKMWEPL